MFCLILATICFSLSFGLIKANLSGLPSEFVVCARLSLAGLAFLPFFKDVADKKHHVAFWVGVVQFGVMYLCFIKAFKFLQGNEIALLTTTTPIFVGLWSMMFGEKFKPVYIFCIFLSVVGAGIIVWQNLSFNLLVKGVILMESANCSFALGQVLWKKFIGEDSSKYMFAAYFGAFVFALTFLLFNFSFLNLTLSMPQTLSLLYLGLVPTGVGFWLWNVGAAQVNASTLAVMNNLKIPFGVLFAIFLFNEKINLLNFAMGTCLIILSILILNCKK